MHGFFHLMARLAFHAVKQFHDRIRSVSAGDKYYLIVVLLSRRLCFTEEVYNKTTVLSLLKHALPQLPSSPQTRQFP